LFGSISLSRSIIVLIKSIISCIDGINDITISMQEKIGGQDGLGTADKASVRQFVEAARRATRSLR